jgi:XTP/dITP diphosphohydrolase
VVDALQGAPGIYSARYAGQNTSDELNLRKLLAELAEVPLPARTARYYCLIVCLRHAEDPMPILCDGVWEGSILFEPRGENGFGYDPIFCVTTHGCSAAELSSATKNALSHRGQAFASLLKKLSLPTP